MTTSNLKKFLVLFLTPPSVLAEWKNTAPDVRLPAERKMQADWQKWMGDHGKMIISTEAGGKTKRVTQQGVADASNDIHLCSFVQAA